MKKIVSILVMLVFAISTVAGCGAAEVDAEDFTLTMQIGSPIMTVNGERRNIDDEGTAPVIQNDRTLVPVRAIIEAMGGAVSWNEDLQMASLTYHNDTIDLTINSITAYLNGAAHTLDTAPAIINNRTMLPIRFIAEGFKFTVGWTQETQTVTIAKANSAEDAEQPNEQAKVLVVYYSATGNTEKIAKYIADETNADVFELEPVNPYTSEDLNWTDDNSRVVREHNNENERNVELKTISVPDWESYDTVFIGYPIWWGIAAWPVNSFVEENDFTGKTVIPFCTSSSSSLGESGNLLAEAAGTGEWLAGKRFSSGASESDVREWTEDTHISAKNVSEE